MKPQEIKALIISSLRPEADTRKVAGRLDDAGISYDFGEEFSSKVLDKIYGTGLEIKREMEFIRSMSSVFYRVALTGVAAIVLLLISIFIMEGSLSIDSFLGIGNTYDESIVYLLTGN